MVKLSQFVPSSPLQTKNAPFVPTILVVDDEPLIADTLVTILRANGYIASAVYNGEQAIKFAALLPPDIVITDLMMPGMNGIDLAVALKEQLPDCAVLLFSGHAQAARLVAKSAVTRSTTFRCWRNRFIPSSCWPIFRVLLKLPARLPDSVR